MVNFWLVARHEYRRTVFRRAFILLTLAIPVGIAALLALAIFVETMGEDRRPVGYVDHAGVLDPGLQASLPDPDERIKIRPFQDEASGRKAVEDGEIQALFVLPAGYPQVEAVDVYVLEKPPSSDVQREVEQFVRLNLVARFPEGVRERLFEGPTVTVVDIASQRVFSEEAVINIVLPFIGAFFFFLATMSAGGYMLQVVADEKENRMMEVILTSLTPAQLIGGKAVGLLAAALTQLTIYVGALVAGIVFGTPAVDFLQGAVIPWDFVGMMLFFFVPSYVLIAAVMLAIGGVVTELQQGQQIAGFLNLIFMGPLFLLTTMFDNPGSPLVTFFSLFPPTAFLTNALRWGLGTIPTWELVVGWVLLVAAAVFTMWAAVRIFRAGMLHYGQSLNLKSVWAAIRQE